MISSRFLSLTAALFCGLCQLSSGARVGNFTYLDTGTSITITRCSGYATGEVTIPSLINEKPVVEIGESAFIRCRRITGITIPPTVTRIGYRGFFECSSLTKVTIPPSVETMGAKAFAYCALVTVELPPNLKELPNSIFYGCHQLEKIILPEGLQTIGPLAFAYSPFSRITFPSTVATIGHDAFFQCPNLEMVTIPPSVTRIGDYAFSGCRRLSSVSFLGNAPSMGADVFGDRSNLFLSEFKIFCSFGSTGFTYPTWHKYKISGPSPEISVEMADGEFATSGESRHKFGNLLIGAPGKVHTFTIKNVGTRYLSGLFVEQRVKIAPDFVVEPLFNSSLAPGKSMSFDVVFKPTAAGRRHMNLRIKSNDPDEGPFEIKLTGTGVDYFN